MRRRNRGFALRPVDSNKNVVDLTATTSATLASFTLAIAKDSAVNTAATEVERGSTIKALWLSFDVCGIAATGVLQRFGCYLMKNPGANLVGPSTFSVGTSNEKKFVIRQWQFMTMRNQDGNNPNHWEGWIKLPRRYQRMGADDTWQFFFRTDLGGGHLSLQSIYKWYK